MGFVTPEFSDGIAEYLAVKSVNAFKHMTRKTWLLLAVAVVLTGASLYLNRDWFARDHIHIYDRSRPLRAGFLAARRVPSAAANPVVFGFDRPLKLTSVKVVPLMVLKTNKNAQPVWHLISDSNSVPTKSFVYGMRIRGMRPADKEGNADPLLPDLPYRLLIEAGKMRAEHDFTPLARAP